MPTLRHWSAGFGEGLEPGFGEGAERLFEESAGAVGADPQGAFGDAGEAGDLGVVELLEVVQDEHFSQGEGEFIERPVELLVEFLLEYA